MDKINAAALELSRKTFRLGRSIRKYLLFILQIVGWTLVLYILTPLLALVQPLFFALKTPMTISDFILLVTAAFVLAYTYQTQKLKEETILQRRMSVAHDVHFHMTHHYHQPAPNYTLFGKITTTEALNNICKVTFLSAVVGSDIGRCSILQNSGEGTYLQANYFIETEEGREAFLGALKLNDGEIWARVLVTNGEKFIYTFRADTENWKKTLGGVPNLRDEFFLVKKEIDEN